MKDIDKKKLYTVKDIAELEIPYMTTINTVRMLIRDGKIKSIPVRNGKLLVRGSEILKFLGV